MKTYFYKAFAAATLLLVSFLSYAGTPVWLIGHRCNSLKMIEYALEDGGNGVEIDVTCGPTAGKEWCVSHSHFVPESKCDSTEWMSLKSLLNKPLLKDPKKNFCLLYVDVKDTKYISELIDYVHAHCPHPNYYILYGLNLDKISKKHITDEKLKVLKEKLAGHDHEAFCTQNDGGIDEIQKALGRTGYPITKYSYVDGCCIGFFGTFSYLKKAAQLRDSNPRQLCARTGFWTCQRVKDGRNSYLKAHCDFTMCECRGWGGSFAWRRTLEHVHNFLANPKNGYEMATKSTKFVWE